MNFRKLLTFLTGVVGFMGATAEEAKVLSLARPRLGGQDIGGLMPSGNGHGLATYTEQSDVAFALKALEDRKMAKPAAVFDEKIDGDTVETYIIRWTKQAWQALFGEREHANHEKQKSEPYGASMQALSGEQSNGADSAKLASTIPTPTPNLSIFKGENLILDVGNFFTSDPGNDNLTIIPSEVSGGRFFNADDFSTAGSFKVERLKGRKIGFGHDGSDTAPDWLTVVTDDAYPTTPIRASTRLSRCDGYDMSGAREIVNTDLVGTQVYPSAAAWSKGYAVLWGGDGPGGISSDVYMQKFFLNGSRDGGNFRVNDYLTDIQSPNNLGGGLTATLDGNMFATWQSNGQDGSGLAAIGRLVRANGTMSTEEQLNRYNISTQANVVVIVTNEGKYFAAWDSYKQIGDNFDIFGKILGPDGKTIIKDEFPLNVIYDSQQSGIQLDKSPNNIAGVWVSYTNGSWGIYSRMFDEAGNALGIESRIDKPPYGGMRAFPKITAAKDGIYDVIWNNQDFQDIRWRRLNASGPFGSEIQIAGSLGAQSVPSMANLRGNKKIIAYECPKGSSGSGICGQLIDLDSSSLIGPAFNISSDSPYSSESQGNPTIIGLDSGDFVAFFSSGPSNGSDWNIHMKRGRCNLSVSPEFVSCCDIGILKKDEVKSLQGLITTTGDTLTFSEMVNCNILLKTGNASPVPVPSCTQAQMNAGEVFIQATGFPAVKVRASNTANGLSSPLRPLSISFQPSQPQPNPSNGSIFDPDTLLGKITVGVATAAIATTGGVIVKKISASKEKKKATGVFAPLLKALEELNVSDEGRQKIAIIELFTKDVRSKLQMGEIDFTSAEGRYWLIIMNQIIAALSLGIAGIGVKMKSVQGVDIIAEYKKGNPKGRAQQTPPLIKIAINALAEAMKEYIKPTGHLRWSSECTNLMSVFGGQQQIVKNTLNLYQKYSTVGADDRIPLSKRAKKIEQAEPPKPAVELGLVLVDGETGEEPEPGTARPEQGQGEDEKYQEAKENSRSRSQSSSAVAGVVLVSEVPPPVRLSEAKAALFSGAAKAKKAVEQLKVASGSELKNLPPAVQSEQELPKIGQQEQEVVPKNGPAI